MATTSSNPLSISVSVSQRPSSRMPGVSIKSAPLPSTISSRWVVVWRPRASLSRTSPVRWVARPTSALTSVDLPTPDIPIKASVFPGGSQGPSPSSPNPAMALVSTTGTPGKFCANGAVTAVGSSLRSILLTIRIGWARLCAATARKRRMRGSLMRRRSRALLPSPKALTIPTTSTLAAMTWGSGRFPEA